MGMFLTSLAIAFIEAHSIYNFISIPVFMLLYTFYVSCFNAFARSVLTLLYLIILSHLAIGMSGKYSCCRIAMLSQTLTEILLFVWPSFI